MFKENKYTKIYYQIINNAITKYDERELAHKNGTAHYERHHIIPQSLNGSNDRSNLVYLTGREHALCHWLLVKMTMGKDHEKMRYAFNGMNAANGYQNRYSSRIITRAYERNRIEFAKIHSLRMKGRPAHNKGKKLEGEELEKHRERTRNRRKPSPEVLAASHAKRLEKMKNFRHSEETKLKQSKALKGRPKPPASDEHRAAISRSTKGKKKTENHADNIRKANIGNISINKDGIEKKVKRDTLDQWLADGWQLGGKKRK